MTTSHRPQLEARSGAKGASYVPTGTQHARLLPGHTRMKLRSKKASCDKEIGGGDGAEVEQQARVESADDEAIEEGEEEKESEEEDDDDQEALLQELNKIRQERMAAKSNHKGDDAVKIEDGLRQVLPMPSQERSWRKSTTFGRNRVGKTASTKSSDSNGEYKNDISRSKYHQDFMRRYVK